MDHRSIMRRRSSFRQWRPHQLVHPGTAQAQQLRDLFISGAWLVTGIPAWRPNHRQSRTPILLMTFQWPEQRVIDNAVNLGKRSIPRDCQYVDIVQANVSASIKLVESCARTGDCYLRPRPLPPPRIHVPFESETVSSDTCEHATAFVAGE